MINFILGLLRYSIILIFGVVLSLMFVGVKKNRSSIIVTIIFCITELLVQLVSWYIFGLENTTKLYPFIVHIPLIVFISLYFKCPWIISISAVLSAYLCFQIPSWIEMVVSLVLNNSLINNISYIIIMCLILYFLNKYVTPSVKQLLERSTQSCLLFGIVPLLYYLFDYITSIYTDILLNASYEVAQFFPTLICAFYFIFVILYYNESAKQIQAQRELDVFTSQLHQAKLDLDNMWQAQNNTMIYRHDMRHHLSLIKGFANDGHIEKIKEYLNSAEENIDSFTPKRYCENETVNLILSTFNTQAQNKNVNLKINVNLPQEMKINDTELCALLSNVLENALTATEQLENEKLRKIYFRALIHDNKLFISTENAYLGKIEMDGELPKSKKKGDRHGFGIKSIMTIVNKYNGLYSFETEGGVFILQILLPLIDNKVSAV